MTAPGHKPRHRQEDWEYSGWAFAATDDPGRKLREKLLRRTLTERKLKRSLEQSKEDSPQLSLADTIRLEHVEIDLRNS